MYKNTRGQYIGRGEEEIALILKTLSPTSIVIQQAKMVDFCQGEFSKRRQKETIDILFYNPVKNIKLAIRVQDKRHNSKKMSRIDESQKMDLEQNGFIVIDILESECPILFKIGMCDEATDEVLNYIKDYL